MATTATITRSTVMIHSIDSGSVVSRVRRKNRFRAGSMARVMPASRIASS
jgi:hypothetical protein